MNKTVHIIGGGSAGLILGKELSLMGIKNIIYDSKRKISDNSAKASGVLSKSGLGALGIDYKDAIVNELIGADIYGRSESMRVKSNSTMAYVLDRGRLAELLYENAIASGSEIILGKRLSKTEILSLNNGSDIIVGADGAISNVASAYKFPEIKHYVLTYKAEYSNANILDKNMVSLHFNNSILKSFFGWTIPYSKSSIEVGIGIFSNNKTSSKNAFAKFIATERIKDILKGSKLNGAYASVIPLSTRRKTVNGNVLLVGDAAGQVKATTGGGIIFGGICARIAAKSIYGHIKYAMPLSNYEHEWRKINGRDLTMHRFFHKYYSILGNTTMDINIKMAKALGFDGFFSKYGDMDRPTKMLKRFFLRGFSE